MKTQLLHRLMAVVGKRGEQRGVPPTLVDLAAAAEHVRAQEGNGHDAQRTGGQTLVISVAVAARARRRNRSESF